MYLPFSDPLHLVIRSSLRRTTLCDRVKRYFYTGIPAFPMWVYVFDSRDKRPEADPVKLAARLGGAAFFHQYSLAPRPVFPCLALDLESAPFAPSAFMGTMRRRVFLTVNLVAAGVNGEARWDDFARAVDAALHPGSAAAPARALAA